MPLTDDRPRCPTCDKPVAAEVDWEHMRHCSTRNCQEGADLCWGGTMCTLDAVDWRARALAAEAFARIVAASDLPTLESTGCVPGGCGAIERLHALAAQAALVAKGIPVVEVPR